MAENEKNDVTYHPAVIEYDRDNSLVTNIGAHRGATEKYEIVFPIPQTDDEAQERYDCTLKDLITMGVRNISTRPDYPSVGFNDDGSLKDGGHEAMQELADGYKVGRRATAGPTQKAKAKEFDSLMAEAAEAGLDMAAVKDMLAKAKGKARK